MIFRLFGIASVCFLGFILWVIWLANSGSESVFFNVVGAMPYADKLGHMVLFGVLTFLVVVSLRFKSVLVGRLRIYLGVILVALFVVAEEMSQMFISTRTFDLLDLSADFLGMMVASMAAFRWRKVIIRA